MPDIVKFPQESDALQRDHFLLDKIGGLFFNDAAHWIIPNVISILREGFILHEIF